MTNTNVKMTYNAALTAVIEGQEITDEVIEKLTALRESLSKKNASKSSGEKKVNEADEAIKDAIMEYYDSNPDAKLTASGVTKVVAACEGLSNQKTTRLFGALVNEHRLYRVVEKRVAYFTAIAPDEA